MRNILKYTMISSALALLVACDKDEDKVMMNANARVEASLSASTLVLSETQSNTTALTVTWEEKDFGVNLAPTYVVELINGSEKKQLSAEKSPFSLTTKELNDYLIGIGLKTGVAADIKVNVKVALSDQRSLEKANDLKVTPYFTEIKPSEWGVVGSATPNGWNGPDISFWNGESGTLVAYATLTTGEIKFRKGNKWENGDDWGDKNRDGILDKEGGNNIPVTAGTYKITWKLSDNTYTIEPYTWGIVGSAANGWDENQDKDIKLSYEGSTNSWVAKNVTLNAGELKFRLNNTWGTNFGADSAEAPTEALQGNVKSGGNNIKVPAGTYNISFSFGADNKGTYKIEKL